MEVSAQLCKVEGTVRDALSGEALIGAYVKSGNQVVATDFDGRFELAMPRGVLTLEVSYIGYESQSREVKCDGASTRVSFALETLVMQEAVVVTDIAIDRKTQWPSPMFFLHKSRKNWPPRSALGVEHHARRVHHATRRGRWRRQGDHSRF